MGDPLPALLGDNLSHVCHVLCCCGITSRAGAKSVMAREGTRVTAPRVYLYKQGLEVIRPWFSTLDLDLVVFVLKHLIGAQQRSQLTAEKAVCSSGAASCSS